MTRPPPVIRLTCPACKHVQELKPPKPEAGDGPDVAERAKRVRAAATYLIEKIVPPSFRRIAQAQLRIHLKDDQRAADIGGDIMRHLLEEGEAA